MADEEKLDGDKAQGEGAFDEDAFQSDAFSTPPRRPDRGRPPLDPAGTYAPPHNMFPARRRN